jgi:hypothetical protein
VELVEGGGVDCLDRGRWEGAELGSQQLHEHGGAAAGFTFSAAFSPAAGFAFSPAAGFAFGAEHFRGGHVRLLCLADRAGGGVCG